MLIPGRYLGGGNSFFLRDVLVRMGGFDPRLGRQGRLLIAGEETYLEWRLRSAGETIFYPPGVRIRHHVARERFRRAWVYRHAFWDGVTGGIMQSLLKETVNPSFDLHAHSPTPQAGNRITRIARQTLRALGFAACERESVAARVYLFYVLGAIGGLIARLRIAKQKRQSSQMV